MPRMMVRRWRLRNEGAEAGVALLAEDVTYLAGALVKHWRFRPLLKRCRACNHYDV
jgi:hypothetical protein